MLKRQVLKWQVDDPVHVLGELTNVEEQRLLHACDGEGPFGYQEEVGMLARDFEM